ncbi:MAG: hypothetical protein D6741_04425 [Planctomycetota bacterium]|nr:MAG: hypothetical protein D6741_04425 [Planctomycetota bacterium]
MRVHRRPFLLRGALALLKSMPIDDGSPCESHMCVVCEASMSKILHFQDLKWRARRGDAKRRYNIGMRQF